MLVLSWERRKSERITPAQLRLMWGDTVSISDRVRHRQLEWLGHAARMEDARLPKRLLSSSLPFPRPAYGPPLRWKDVVSRHLAACGCHDWFGLSRDCNRWRREVVLCIPDAEPQIEPLCVLYATDHFTDLLIWRGINALLSACFRYIYNLVLPRILPAIAGLLRAVAWLFTVFRFRIRSCLLPQPNVPHWRSVHLSLPGRLLHISMSDANADSVVSKT